jgi:protein-disulfide isomerase
VSPTARGAAFAALALLPFAAGGQDKPSQPEKNPPAPLAALVGETRITALELEERVGPRLIAVRSQEYELKRQALEEMIGDILLKQEAESRGVPVEQLVKDEIDAKVPPITDEDVTKMWEQVKGRFPGKTQADYDAEMRSRLQGQRYQARRAEVVKQLRAKSNVKLILDPPRLPVRTAGGPAKGGPNAAITIVEYSDFQCPYCSRVKPTLKKLADRYGDQVRLVFRDLPLPIHAQAPKAAEAAACADEQGKFWEMHDRLFANQAKLQVADLKQHAADLGLDAEKFNECLDSGKRAPDVKQSAEEAQRNGVSSTPSFFINGRLLAGAQPYENFTRVIDDELTRAGLPIPPEPPAPAPSPSPDPQAEPKVESQ